MSRRDKHSGASGCEDNESDWFDLQKYCLDQARAILGDDEDDEDSYIKDAARLIQTMMEDQPAASEGLRFEHERGAVSRRAGLLMAVAEYHRAGVKLSRQFGMLSVPALLAVFRALGFEDAYWIVEGLHALMRGCARDEAVDPSAALIQALMVEPAKLWIEWTDYAPVGPCNPDAEHVAPWDDTGAEFVFRMIRAAKWDCTREEIEDNLDAVHALLLEANWIDALPSAGE